ncbi:uncharacterized protein LAJ45_10244 [Morchella importuna]|uniref:uncharacterized protein n=1 Tax=Morchella importuna TaxID=1174673 RepID=UPI001E8E870A|nr:uncharacterized protein LAJ45_10244 [Morchella importuna]KAH8145767.1 hypothetical protein LAJ45_10244 [Morchella importuna]
MGDPSASVSPQLLHHLHAVCVMKYPICQSIQPEHLIDLLLKAPTVVQQYPFTWTMIEPPPAGTLMLSWHPPQMGTGCASDGYVWADPENVHTVDVKGYQVEIYYHKAGFNPNPNLHPLPHLPSRNPQLLAPPLPQRRAPEPGPIASIPITQGARQSFSARSYIAQLFAAGQLPRKEFYLGDPSTWPMITLPNQQQQQQQQQQQPLPPQTPQSARPMAPRGTPMQSAPPPQQPGGGYYTPTPTRPAPPKPAPPSAKRLKPTPPTHPQAAVDPGMTIDEEEDTSRGDMLDHLSPREIATTRYIQHHEWMEEVLGSVYSISRIKPVDLGLGLRGELESVTMGLLDPPSTPNPGNQQGRTSGKRPAGHPRAVPPPRRTKDRRHRGRDQTHGGPARRTPNQDLPERHRKRSRAAPPQHHGRPTPTSPDADDAAAGVDPVLAQLHSADIDTRAMDAIVAEVEAAIGKKVIEKQMLVKWELPIDEIVKMGGVVAEGASGLDTIMDGEEEAKAGSSGAAGAEGDEFAALDLDVGGETAFQQGEGEGSAVEGQGQGQEGEEGGLAGVDTIMDDFMNVDSKPDTPAGETKDMAGEDGNPDDGFTFDAGDDKDGISGDMPSMELLGSGDDAEL